MIRTRDIFIFVILLFILGVAIAWTVSRDIQWGLGSLSEIRFDPEGTPSSFEVIRDDIDRNRENFIEHLRSMLASNDIDIVPEPSVEEVVIETASSTESADEEGSADLLSCGGEDAQSAIRSWPLSGVTLETVGSVRQVMHTPVSVGGSASTTAQAQPQILIQFPVVPQKTGSPSCVGSEIIGISVTGSLMYNNEASFYRGFGSEYLIGYARDGFPIYGYYEGSVDSCGGYDHPSGYRYSVTPQSDHIIRCYSGQSAPFLPM